MRPAEEQSLHGYWDGDDRPDPLVAQSAPEFVAQLRALVQWSGLTLDEIEQLARANGDILPPSILSAALSHHTLPPEEVVVALVAAVGDDDHMVELWASVLWRLEEGQAASPMATHTVPSPVSSVTGAASVAAVRQYSGGALADAVHKRRNQNSWTGLHRSFKKGLRATGFGSKYGRWPVPVAIGATVFILVAGIAWAVAGGGNGQKTAEPPSNPCCTGKTDGGASASADPQGEVPPSALPLVLPVPGISTKPTNSPTPRPTPPRNSPTPTQTQTQLNPTLTGNGTASCADSGGNWVVTLSVTAVLTGATSGNNPQGRAGKPGELEPFTVSGGGTTSFSGQASITIGPSGGQVSGSVEWSVTVTVTGAGSVPDTGNAAYTCGAGGT